MAKGPSGKSSFEELNREIRNYLAEVADEMSATRALKKIEATEAEVRRATKSITRAFLLRAAKAGFEIHDGEVHEPKPPHGSAGKVSTGPLLPVPEEAEIQQARSIQTKLLPSKLPTVPGIDLSTFNRFSREVGGDYYDFFDLPRNRVGMVIADVSGKGVPAAMVMVMFRSILRMVAANDHSPADTLIHTNRLLARDLLRGMFVTALYVVIDPAAHAMTFVNCGHNPPLIWRPRLSGTRAINIRGPALGILTTDRFKSHVRERTLVIEPGDVLCLYTDGVNEAKNLLGEDFGERALARILRAHGERPAREIVHALVAAVDAHQEEAPQHDDITLIVMRAVG